MIPRASASSPGKKSATGALTASEWETVLVCEHLYLVERRPDA